MPQKSLRYGWTQDDLDAYNKSRAVTKQNQILKYGEIEGTKRFESYCAKQSKNGNKLEYFTERYGEIEGLLRYRELNKKKAITLYNLMQKYGEEVGTEKYKAIIARQSRPVICKFVEKYGEIEGKKRYADWIDRHSNFGGASKVQKDVISALLLEFPEFTNTHHSCFTTEYAIPTVNSRIGSYWMYDFVLVKRVKICIEFQGDYWHANPKLFSADKIFKFPGTPPQTAQQIWDKDTQKKLDIEARGFSFYEIWENDFMKNPSLTLLECKKWILEKLKLNQ